MVQAMGKSQTLTADERGSGVLPANSFGFLIGVWGRGHIGTIRGWKGRRERRDDALG